MATGTLRASAPLVVEYHVVDNNTVNANSALSVNFTNIGKTGYTILGIVGASIANASSSGTGSQLCAIKAFFASGTDATLAIKNNGSSAAKVKAELYILYQKN